MSLYDKQNKIIEKINELFVVVKDYFDGNRLDIFFTKEELKFVLNGFFSSLDLVTDRLSKGERKKWIFLNKWFFGKDEKVLDLLIVETDFLIVFFKNLINSKEISSDYDDNQDIAGELFLRFRKTGFRESQNFYLLRSSSFDGVNKKIIFKDGVMISKAAEIFSVFIGSLSQFEELKSLFETIKEFSDIIKIAAR